MSEPKQPVAEVDFFTKAEIFFEQNKKAISIGGSVALAAVLALFAFYGFYLPGKEQDAQDQMFRAQQYFEQDSFRLALNGDGNYVGFLSIIDDYGFTKASNLSQYYAGVSFLRLGEYDNAIKHLKKFSSKGEPVLCAMAKGALGDAYSEKNDMNEAISYYKKAADELENELITPYYLFKAGLALKVQGKKEDALKLFQKIKNEYPESTEGREIDKYIALVN